MVMDIKTFTDKELLAEIGRRMMGFNQNDKPATDWVKFKMSIENSKHKPLGSSFSEKEKEAVKYLVDTFYSEGHEDIRLLAYALATVRIECGSNMMPVREGFAATDELARAHVKKHNRKYATEFNGHVYYGRGYVQLTWLHNYKQEGIENNPDKALGPEFAARLLFKGLLDGRWNGSGKGLMYYLDQGDVYNARRTVNATNKAQTVANWYFDFLEAFETSKIV
jgi:hypothetical protein